MQTLNKRTTENDNGMEMTQEWMITPSNTSIIACSCQTTRVGHLRKRNFSPLTLVFKSSLKQGIRYFGTCMSQLWLGVNDFTAGNCLSSSCSTLDWIQNRTGSLDNKVHSFLHQRHVARLQTINLSCVGLVLCSLLSSCCSWQCLSYQLQTAQIPTITHRAFGEFPLILSAFSTYRWWLWKRFTN